MVHGEAGVGKTALLEDAIASAAGMRMARVAGIESEMELAYAALQQLCAPMLDGLDQLPDPQREALGVVFGLRAGEAPDRFLVGLAGLSLLADAAGKQPLLCVIDDAQWLDRASAQAMGFVARRLFAEQVAVVVATREPGGEFRGLPELLAGEFAAAASLITQLEAVTEATGSSLAPPLVRKADGPRGAWYMVHLGARL